MLRLIVTLCLCAACGVPTPLETHDLWAGIEALQAGDARAALDRFDRVDAAPHPALLLNRALALHQVGDDAPALAALDDAVARSADPALRARVLTDRGTVRARAGRTNDAIADYRAALRLAPADDLARHNLELLLRVIDDLDAGTDTDDDGQGFTLDQAGPTPAVDLATALISPDPGRGVLDAYWRWTTYDTFDGRRWSARAEWAPEPQPEVPAAGTLVQTISFLVRPDAALFGLDHVVSITAAGKPIMRRGWDRRTSEPVRTFTVTSNEAITDDESDPVRYLRLPARFDPRIRALAMSVSAEEQDPERAAALLSAWLASHLTYAQVRQERALDPLAAFLFSSKRGDCRLFSSALTIMLRSRGFQARLVAGYVGGRRVGEARYLLSSSDLHAWVEVRGRRGWARFDPTPARDDGPFTAAAAARLVDSVRAKPATNFALDGGARGKPTRDW